MARVVALCALLTAQAALAQQRRVGVVARAARGAPEGEPALARAATRALEGREVVVDPVDRAAARRAVGAVQRERLDRLKRAQELIDEGWRAYLKVEADFADARLVAARASLEEVLYLDGAYELLADATLRLGAVRLFTGRQAEAQAAFVLAAALDPERDPGPKDFAPEVLEAYARARTHRPLPVSLEVVVRGAAGAEVEIDGRMVGTAPVRLEVGAGEHTVVARARGRVPAGRIVRVGEGPVELNLDEDLVGKALAAGERGLRPGTDAVTTAAILAAASTYAELDELLLLGSTWRGGQPTLLAQRCSAAPVRCGPVLETRGVPQGKLDAAVATLIERTSPAARGKRRDPVLLEDTRMTEPEPPVAESSGRGGGRSPDGTRRRWWRNPWVWVAAGAAVGLVGAGIWVIAGDRGGGTVVEGDPCLARPGACP